MQEWRRAWPHVKSFGGSTGIGSSTTRARSVCGVQSASGKVTVTRAKKAAAARWGKDPEQVLKHLLSNALRIRIRIFSSIRFA